jgi:hypothetical protein
MGGIAHRFQETVVAPRAAHVLGWARPASRNASRITRPRLGSQDLLHGQRVRPAVAEVVDVTQPIALPRELGQRGLRLVGDLTDIPVRVRLPAPGAVDLELVQM